MLGGDTLIAEIDVISGNRVINFINAPATFPTNVTSTYSGLGVKFTITFQAIQNYIPDENGNKISNTIQNSYKIFDYFNQMKYEPTPLSFFTFTYDSNNSATIRIADGVTLPENLVLPTTDANGNPITSIGSNFLNGNTTVKNVVIPSSYTSLKNYAFSGSSVESVDLSQSSITTLPQYCFNGIKTLTNIKLNEGLTELGTSCLKNTGIKSLTLPSTITTIGNLAISQLSLNALYIPASVSYISETALNNSKVLMKILVDESNSNYYDIDNVMLCSKSGVMLNLVSAYEGTSLVVPEGVTKILQYAMPNSTNVTSVSYPSTVQEINSFPPNMTSFTISEYNTYIVSPTGYELIYTSDGRMFKFCIGDLTDYVIPDECIIVADNIFVGTTLNSLTIGANVSTVTGYSFSSMKVDYIYVVSSNTNMYTDNNIALISNSGIFCLYSYSAKNVEYTVPLGVNTIGYQAFFSNNNLQKIIMQTGVTQFSSGYYTFKHCYSLKYIKFPSTLTTISVNFCTYTHLQQTGTLIFEGTIPPTCSGLGTSKASIYVPDSALDTYKSTSPYSSVASKIYGISQYVEE
ncbi:MAG: leucine-rich repeat protein [Christensenellales bacterium]